MTSDSAASGPERLHGYRILRRIGEGAMGIVYLAEQERLGRRVAVKMIRHELGVSEAALSRLRREAESLARVSHPNVVRVLDCGRHEGVLFLAMDHVPGRSLKERIAEAGAARRPIPVAEVLGWGRDVARGLAAAHDARVVHRDVKPSNVRITDDGRAVLLDFGLARSLADASTTLTGQFQGTPHYASPEQVAAHSQHIGAPTDVYSLGITLYEALAGRVPFPSRTVEGVFRQILLHEPRPLRRSRPDVPGDLETVVSKAIAKVPSDRYPSAADLADDLEAVLQYRPIRARRAGMLRRLGKWTRRRRGTAVALAVATLALLSVPIVLAWEGSARRKELQSRVDELCARAASAIEDFQRTDARRAELAPEVAHDREELRRRFLGAEEDAARRRRVAELRAVERRRDASFLAALEQLSAAESLLPAHPRIRALRADAHMASWRALDLAADPQVAAATRALVEADDPDGRHAAELRALGRVHLATEPPGADVYLFRYREHADAVPGGQRRLVPVPVRGEPTIAPGTTVLRVTHTGHKHRRLALQDTLFRALDSVLACRVRDATGLYRDLTRVFAVPRPRTDRLELGDLILEIEGYPVDGLFLVTRGNPPVERLDRIAAIDGKVPRSYREVFYLARAAPSDTGPKTFRFERRGEFYEVRARDGAELGIGFVHAGSAAGRGGFRGLVYRNGRTFETTLPKDLGTRVTAAPLLPTAECRIGKSPIRGLELEAGSYIALLRKHGCEDQRLPFVVRRGGDAELRTELLFASTSPRSFPYVAVTDRRDGREPFWMADFEVMSGFYLQFLNDPATRKRIDAAPVPILYPRRVRAGRVVSVWRRDAKGRYRAPPGSSLPVRYISHEDARAFAAWLTERDRWRFRGGKRFRYDLPLDWQWLHAARGADDRPFVYGHHFRPHWAHCYHARTDSFDAPAQTVSYPIDESPFAIYDLAGNVAEWCRDGPSASSASDRRLVRGGSYLWRDPADLALSSFHIGSDQGFAYHVGIRLVAWRE